VVAQQAARRHPAEQFAVVVADDEHAVHAVFAHDAADPLQRGRL